MPPILKLDHFFNDFRTRTAFVVVTPWQSGRVD